MIDLLFRICADNPPLSVCSQAPNFCTAGRKNTGNTERLLAASYMTFYSSNLSHIFIRTWSVMDISNAFANGFLSTITDVGNHVYVCACTRKMDLDRLTIHLS